MKAKFHATLIITLFTFSNSAAAELFSKNTVLSEQNCTLSLERETTARKAPSFTIPNTRLVDYKMVTTENRTVISNTYFTNLEDLSFELATESEQPAIISFFTSKTTEQSATVSRDQNAEEQTLDAQKLKRGETTTHLEPGEFRLRIKKTFGLKNHTTYSIDVLRNAKNKEVVFYRGTLACLK